MRALTMLLACCAALAGGAARAPAADLQTLTLGNEDRTYRLYRPASLSWSHSAPLVVMLHGGFGSGLQAENDYRWDALADTYGFVVVYPDGIDHSWNAGGCCGPAMRHDVDDVRFLTALVEHVRANQRIDPSRIYVTGISNGAMMAYRLACESTVRFAAVGSVAGTLEVPCGDATPTSILHVHGLDDRNVPFHGGMPTQGVEHSPRMAIPDVIARWRAIDGCAKASVTAEGPVTTDAAHCADGRDVTLVTIAGAGHQWPGGMAPTQAAAIIFHLDPPSRALDATGVLWTFFSKHSL